jgi:uncharacterized membrane protein YphA (DoxX/SURF4 family)
MGVDVMMHGYPKMKNPKMVAEGVKKGLGVPFGATYAAMILEFFGGIFLVIGLIVPIVSLFFAIFMLSNIVAKKTKLHAVFTSSTGPSYEIDILYLMLSIVLFVLGAGALSVDKLLGL